VGAERGNRRADIRRERWEEVKKEAFVRVAYERNAERLLAELESRDAAAAMRTLMRAAEGPLVVPCPVLGIIEYPCRVHVASGHGACAESCWRTTATVATVREAVRENEEVVPVNVSTWVLPSGVTVGQ